MNREQIETTPAGPDLDRMVAEAMGWKEIRPLGSPDKFWTRPDGTWFQPVSVLKPWSTDIAAAWELVEEMHADGDCASIYYLQDVGELYWIAEFRMRDVHGAGDTAQEAITRAYLLAKLEGDP